MGQQISPISIEPLTTDRSISFYAEPLTQRSSNDSTKSVKTINAKSIQELDLLKQIFNFRLKNKQHLLYCYGFQVINSSQNNPFQHLSCKSVSVSIKINFHYQNINSKFSDLYQVSVYEGLRLLSHCLEGFSLLYDRFGYFTPDSRLINKQGDKWKVWLSQNMFALKIKSSTNKKNNISKQKFLQQVVHLFDVLRDQQNPDFSYSSFIYGRTKIVQQLPLFQLNEIKNKLDEILQIQKSLNKHKLSLKRLSMSSNETVRKMQCNTLISFDQKQNDATISKFNNSKINTKLNKSLNNYKSMNDTIQKQYQYQPNINDKQFKKRQSLHRYRKNSLSNHINYSQFNKQTSNKQNKQIFNKQNKQISQITNLYHFHTQINNFKRVSSKLIPQYNLNQNTKENQNSQHLKNRSSVSTPTNYTGWNKTITPLKLLSTKIKQGLNNSNFTKKQRSFTMDLSNNQNQYDQYQRQQRIQPQKITQNSQVNSQSDQNLNANKNFDKAFMQSQSQIHQAQPGQKLGPVQIISKNPTSDTPSITHKARMNEKQTMKYLKQYILNTSKDGHKRSLTDHIGLNNQNKIKYCWSQQFDSQFFSMDSIKQNTFAMKVQQNNQVKQKRQVQEAINQDQSVKQQDSHKKIKKVVKISQDFYKNDEDCICQKSNLELKSESSGKEASIGRLPIFKSQGGFKSLWDNSKLGTLKSIKQIQVDIPIDEDILNDLNKMFTKHRFAKSSKLTK